MGTDVIPAKLAMPAGRLLEILTIAALVLILLGAKILFIRNFGSAVPYWDQWDAEADSLYKAYLNSNLSWSALLAPHNEHRILLTRLLSLALFELDGGWDPILQMIVNAGLHVVAIVLLVQALQRILGPGQLITLVSFVALLFVLPIGWENLLAGFQSQFYLLLIFSILALSGFAVAPAFSFRWWISAVSAVAAFFSMASGALIGVAAIGVIALQLLLRVRRGNREYAGAALLLAMSAVMIVYVPHVAGHDDLKANGIRQLLAALLTSLSYPSLVSFAGALINLPLFVYACFVLTTRPSRTSPHWVVLSLVVWWFGQVLSISYGRAVAPTSSRYLDITIMAMPMNFAILLFSLKTRSRQWQLALSAVTLVWLAVLMGGLIWNFSSLALPSVVEKAAQSREQEANVASYLRSGDEAALQNKTMLAIPYPSSARLASLLSDPVIRMALPRAIRPADISEGAMLERTVLHGRFRAVIDRIERSLLDLSPVLLGLGIALALGAGLFRRQEDESLLPDKSVDGRPGISPVAAYAA